MIALIAHELRLVTRRAAWPAALLVSSGAAALFVAVWGPENGVPLWTASVLQQLTAVTRVLLAVSATWLSTYVLTDDADGGHRLSEWSVATGRSPAALARARVIAAVVLCGLMVIATAPAIVAASQIASASSRAVAGALGGGLGFVLLSVGVTAATAIAQSGRLAVWCTAMAICVAAAAGVGLFDAAVVRAAAPALAGLALLTAAPLAAQVRKSADDR